jgi:hypothetical protein
MMCMRLGEALGAKASCCSAPNLRPLSLAHSLSLDDAIAYEAWQLRRSLEADPAFRPCIAAGCPGVAMYDGSGASLHYCSVCGEGQCLRCRGKAHDALAACEPVEPHQSASIAGQLKQPPLHPPELRLCPGCGVPTHGPLSGLIVCAHCRLPWTWGVAPPLSPRLRQQPFGRLPYGAAELTRFTLLVAAIVPLVWAFILLSYTWAALLAVLLWLEMRARRRGVSRWVPLLLLSWAFSAWLVAALDRAPIWSLVAVAARFATLWFGFTIVRAAVIEAAG